MGSSKKRIQEKAENRAQETTALEHQRAQDLTDRLVGIRSKGEEIYNTPELATGGYDMEQVNKSRNTLAPLMSDTDYSGAGREGYAELASTGGFNQQDKENFLRRASAPVAAMYARQKDEQNRRLSLQSGYMPGFTSSLARLTRQGAQAGAESSLNANVDLAEQVRQGKISGLGGLERTRIASGTERIAATQALNQLEGKIADANLGALEQKLKAQIAGTGVLTDTERLDISNRLASAGVSQNEIDSLLGIDRNKRGGLGMALDSIGAVSGAVEGVAGAFSKGKISTPTPTKGG